MTTLRVANDLAGLLEYIGLENLQDLGNEIRAECPNNYLLDPRTKRPLHEEADYHWWHWSVNKSTGRHFCFSCNYGGSLHKLVGDLTGNNPWEVARIIHQFGVTTDNNQQEPTVFERPTAISENNLLSFPLPPTRALNYRKLNYDSLRRFDIHWNPETDGWILPIRGPNGDLWGWQEKSPDRVLNFPPRIKKSRTLFGLHLIANQATKPIVILVESPLDVAYLGTFHQLPAVSSFGCLISDQQMNLIVQTASALILALDNDDAGRRETKRLLTAGWHNKRQTYVIDYAGTKAKDVGEMTPEQVNEAIDGAVDARNWR